MLEHKCDVTVHCIENGANACLFYDLEFPVPLDIIRGLLLVEHHLWYTGKITTYCVADDILNEDGKILPGVKIIVRDYYVT